MIGWLIYDRNGSVYNQAYINFYMEEGKKLDIDIRLILAEELEIGVLSSRCFVKYQGAGIAPPGFAICRTIYPLLSKQLELLGIPVFNSSMIADICNDKAKTYQYLAGSGIPMVDSVFCQSSRIGDSIGKVNQPSVIKAVDGHGGKQVFLIDDAGRGEGKDQYKEDAVQGEHDKRKQTIQEVINGLGSSDALIQPLVGKRHQDLRVYVIGREIIACVLRTAREGFKSNFSLGGKVCLYQLKEEERCLVEKIIGRFDFGLVGIDFIIGDHGELIFNEIEDVVGARMLYQCSDINPVEKYLRFIRNQLYH